MDSTTLESNQNQCPKKKSPSKNQNRLAKGVDPDEMAHEWSHQELHCLHRYLFQSKGLKGLSNMHATKKKQQQTNCTKVYH